MEVTQEEERIIRTCGISREAFIAERKREEAEKAARGEGSTGLDGDGLSAEDRRVVARTGISKEAFIAERKRERATGTTTASRGGGEIHKTISLTADDGELRRVLAIRDERRRATASA